ncbi:hypothetical protein pb186bvf_007135 [Paramecium bursaria]
MNLNSKRLPKQDEILSSQNKENMVAWAAKVFDHDKKMFKQLMVEATNRMTPGAYMLADMFLFYKPYDLIATICKCQSSIISDDKKRIKEAFKILMDFKHSNDKHVKQLMDTAMRNIHYFERIGIDKQIELIIMIYDNFEISLTYMYGFLKKQQPNKEIQKLLEIRKEIVRKIVAIKLDYIEKENRYQNLIFIKKLSEYEIIKPIDVELDEVEKNYGQDCLTTLIKSPLQKQLGNYKFTKTFALIRDGFDKLPPKELLDHIKVILFLIQGIKTVELNQQLILYLFNCMLGINIMNFMVTQEEFVFQDITQLGQGDEAQDYHIFILNVAFLFIKKQEHYTIRYLEKVIELNFEFSQSVLDKVIFMLQGLIQQEMSEIYYPYVEKILLKIDKQLFIMFRQVTDKQFRLSQLIEPQEQLNIWVSLIIREKDIKFLIEHFEDFYNICLKIHYQDKLLADINLFDLMHVFSVTLNMQQILPQLQSHLKTNKQSVDECFYQFWTLTYKIVAEQHVYSFQLVASIVVKMLYYTLRLACQPNEDHTIHFQHYRNSMQAIKFIIDNLTNQNPPSQKQDFRTYIYNLMTIQRFCDYFELKNTTILKYILEISQEQVPLFVILRLSQTKQEFEQNQQQYEINYKQQFSKDIKRETKYHYQRLSDIAQLKFLEMKDQSQKFLHQTQMMLLYFKQAKTQNIKQFIILEQIIHQLTCYIWQYDENAQIKQLFEQGKFKLFGFDILNYVNQNDEVLAKSLFMNERFDRMFVFKQCLVKSLKLMNKLGFYRQAQQLFSRLEVLLKRLIDAPNLLRIYKICSWNVDFVKQQQIMDSICSLASLFGKNVQSSESARKSFCQQRRSIANQFTQLHSQIMASFGVDNFMKNKLQPLFHKLVIDFLQIKDYFTNNLLNYFFLKKQLKPFPPINCELLSMMMAIKPINFKQPIDIMRKHKILDKDLANTYFPSLILEQIHYYDNVYDTLTDRELFNMKNFFYQALLITQDQLQDYLLNDIELSRLYFYLQYNLLDILKGETFQNFSKNIEQQCGCYSKRQIIDEDLFLFQVVSNLASFQLNQKRIMINNSKLTLKSLSPIFTIDQLVKFSDIHVQRDVISILMFEYYGEHKLFVSKFTSSQQEFTTQALDNVEFKQTLIDYIQDMKNNLDQMTEQKDQFDLWWQHRKVYEKKINIQLKLFTKQLKSLEEVLFDQQKTLLILSPQLQMIPWDYLSDDITFNRVLSIGQIFDIINNPIQARQDFFCVLNPEGDINKSETRLLPVLNKKNLPVKVREKPSKDEIEDALIKKKYYLYIGHGGGEQYFNEKDILKSQYKFSGRPILLGCNSAQTIDLERFKKANLKDRELLLDYIDCFGASIGLLLKGCPLLFGSLWPCTDRDADKYGLALINQYANYGYMKPEKIIREVREQLDLKFFNGTTFIIFGFSD